MTERTLQCELRADRGVRGPFEADYERYGSNQPRQTY
jgi:hypothetical protein